MLNDGGNPLPRAWLASLVLIALFAWTATAEAGPGDSPIAPTGALSGGLRTTPAAWLTLRPLRPSLPMPEFVTPTPTLASVPASAWKLDAVSLAHLWTAPSVPPFGVSGIALAPPAAMGTYGGAFTPQPSDQEPDRPAPGRSLRWRAPSSSQQSERAGEAPDDRSAWARWNSSLWGVSATMGTIMGGMIVGFSRLPSDVTGWQAPKYEGLKGNFTVGPRFDNDRTYFNYVAHPVAGSEFYLAARNRDCTWWQSLAYSAALSTGFEFFIESAYERASWQDLWITPVSGAVIGELRWQLKKSLEDPASGKPIGTANKVLYVLIDPVDGLYKL